MIKYLATMGSKKILFKRKAPKGEPGTGRASIFCVWLGVGETAKGQQQQL